MTLPFLVTTPRVYVFVLEYKKTKKQIKKSKTMTKDIAETLEFIEHVKESLEATYSHLWDKTREIIDRRTLSKADKSHLEWGITHMYRSKEDFMRDLNRHADTLKHELYRESNAGKSV